MGEPVAASLDDRLLEEAKELAAAEGVSVTTFLQRAVKRRAAQAYSPPVTERLPKSPKSIDEILAENFNRQTQIALMRGFGSMGGGEQRFPTAAEIAAELAKVIHPQPTQSSGINIQSIVDGTVAARLAKSLLTDDATATGGPLKEFVDKQMTQLQDQIKSLTTGLTQSEKQRQDEAHAHEKEVAQAQIDELNGQLADLKERVNNPPNANQPQDLNTKVNELVANLTALQTLSQRVQQVTGGHSTQQPGEKKDFWGQLTEVLDGVSRAGANVAETASRISAARRGEAPADYSAPSGPQLYRTPYASSPPPPASTPLPTVPAAPPAPAPQPPPAAPTPAPAGAAQGVSSWYARGVPVPAPGPATPPITEQAAPAPEPTGPATEEATVTTPAPPTPAPSSLIEASPEQLAQMFPANVGYLDPVSGERLPREAFIAKYGDAILRNPDKVKLVPTEEPGNSQGQ